MSTNTEVLNVQIRESRGTTSSKRLRAAGQIPAVLYGHGQDTVNIAVKANEIDLMIRHGSRVVDLKGGLEANAFVKEVQWDAFGHEILHLDFTRVSKGETVETTVLVELRGDAPGTKVGGVLQHLQHDLEMTCPVQNIPEKIEVNINTLELGESVTAGDLELPEGAVLKVEDSTVIVQCVEAIEEEEEVEPSDGAEPEVIGRKADEDDDE